MAVLMFSSLFLLFLSGLPLLTYFYAKNLGRDPKKWLMIGILLPGIATIILSLLPKKNNKAEP